MKKSLLVLICYMIGHSLFGQGSSAEFSPMKSPDVTAFLNMNYLPIDESTGKADISIPIYNIDLDGLNIPISISYNIGGVKVNAAASKVGLN